MPSVERGDIVWVTFPDPNDVPDEEFENPHPAIVIQNNSRNHEYDTTIVAPLTTAQNRSQALADVRVSSASEDVEEDSIAKLGMLTTVSVPGRIMDESDNPEVWKMGELSASKMDDIEKRLDLVLGLS